MEFAAYSNGEVVVNKANANPDIHPDHFDRSRGKADIKWRTDELMALLRSED